MKRYFAMSFMKGCFHFVHEMNDSEKMKQIMFAYIDVQLKERVVIAFLKEENVQLVNGHRQISTVHVYASMGNDPIRT